MASTQQVIARAIITSITEDRVVHVGLEDMQSGDTLQDAIDVLSATACDDDGDSVRNGPEHEAWGTNEDGDWRVHINLR